jgi:hypothetical protein
MPLWTGEDNRITATTTRRGCLPALRESQRYEPFGGEPYDGVDWATPGDSPCP